MGGSHSGVNTPPRRPPGGLGGLVGVVLQGKGAVRLLDLVRRRGPLDAERRVVVRDLQRKG